MMMIPAHSAPLTHQPTSPGSLQESASITLRGAKLNNLKSIDLDIPLGQFVLVTGPSGSGKSTLVFDLLYQEGQRRFLSSLSSYVRQYFERIEKPPVEQLSHLPPVIGLKQGQETRQARASVASMTHLDETLHQLFHVASHGYCDDCGEEHPLFQHTEASIFEHLTHQIKRYSATRTMAHKQSAQLKLLVRVHAPLTKSPEPTIPSLHKDPSLKLLADTLAYWQQQGLQRVDCSAPHDTHFTASNLLPLPETRQHTDLIPTILESPWGKAWCTQSHHAQTIVSLPFIFRRLVFQLEPDSSTHFELSPLHQSALSEVIQFSNAQDIAWDIVLLEEASKDTEPLSTPQNQKKILLGHYHQQYGCGSCGKRTIRPDQVGYFNAHHALGACPDCEGYGWVQQLSETKIIPNPNKSLQEGAIYPFQLPAYQDLQLSLIQAAQAKGISVNTPWQQLSPEAKQWVFKGDAPLGYEGIEGLFAWVESKKYKPHMRMFLARFRSYSACHTCHGTGHHQNIHTYTLASTTLPTLNDWTIEHLYHWCTYQLPAHTFFQNQETQDLFLHLQQRLKRQTEALITLGLGYLPLNRAIKTVSSGEHQRLLLASCLSHQLSDTLYLLDEPSLGLHPQDVQGLMVLIRHLIAQGNSVIAVDHHRSLMEEADWLIELGPESGQQGGTCVGKGTLSTLLTLGTPTSHFLASPPMIPCSQSHWNKATHQDWLTLTGVKTHHLKNIDVSFPVKAWSCITGVSGAGKTSLVIHSLVPALRKAMNEAEPEIEERWHPKTDYKALKGFNPSVCHQLIVMDQQKLHSSSRSTPAIYLKVWDDIRYLFAQTRDAIQLNLTPGDFSFNSAKGRCPKCEGLGYLTVDMQFMADVKLTCDACHGRRFQPSILSVKYEKHSIDAILALTFRQAQDVFKEEPNLVKKLQAIDTLGLGYLQLGQSLTTLSGGEAQRLKLLQQLLQPQNKPCIYILDEPSSGLHPQDVLKLCTTLRLLCERGHTVICIDHQETLLGHCDHLITLGPGSGEAGGFLL
ncbi:MAG: hypothetical protein ACKO37_03485 [Vampirovibrionales bacterium]